MINKFIIQEPLLKSMKDYENTIAIECENEQISYKELDAVTDKIAQYIHSCTVKKQSHIGVLMNNKVNNLYAVIGIIKAGGVFILLDNEYPANRLSDMIHTADIDLLLYDETDYKCNQLINIVPKSGNLINIIINDKVAEDTFNFEYESNDKLYIYFTSGTSGKPKAIVGKNESLLQFINWEIEEFNLDKGIRVSQLTSPCHDPYLRDVFVPLLSGGTICIPSHRNHVLAKGLALWIEQTKINLVHCTPGIFNVINSSILSPDSFPELKYILLAGEKVKPYYLKHWFEIFGDRIQLVNLYGPTETTLAKIFYRIKQSDVNLEAIPIGKPIDKCKVILLDEKMNVSNQGEIYIKSPYMSLGYYNNEQLNNEKFIQNPFVTKKDIIYKTGDNGRLLPDGNIVFTGRNDKQIKIRGNRVEIDEVEQKIQSFEGINECIVEYKDIEFFDKQDNNICSRCGITAKFPEINIDEKGICNLCLLYEEKKNEIQEYFKTPEDFMSLFTNSEKTEKQYDCLLLFSGGKDSTFVLSKLLSMGLRVLAYFFDNGYTSEQAYENIKKTFGEFNVEYVIDSYDKMDEIFLAGIKKENSVCNGCFKVLRLRSTKLAYEKGIKYIITGLTRGQIFDLRLESIYKENCFDVDEVEKKIEEQRLIYFSKNDYVVENMENYRLKEDVLRQVKLVDFFRYFDYGNDEIYEHLNEYCPFWERPKDTGKSSSNCLINDVGIYLQQRTYGYDNYTSKKCWEVRLSNNKLKNDFHYDNIDISKVNSILSKLGYSNKYMDIQLDKQFLNAYYVADRDIDEEQLKYYLKQELIDYMIPANFYQLTKIPLTDNGKIDYSRLIDYKKGENNNFIEPRTETERKIIEIWKEIINVDNISVTDSFMDIGGNSLNVLNLISKIYSEFEVELDIGDLFNKSTVETIAQYIDTQIKNQFIKNTIYLN